MKLSIPARVFLTTLGTATIAIVTTVILLGWIAANTSEIAAEETRKRVAGFIALKSEAVATLTTDYAHWNAAFEWYSAGEDEQLYQNLGTGASEGNSFDLIYFATRDGDVTHAYGADVYSSDLGFVEPDIIDAALPAMAELQPGDFAVSSGMVGLPGTIAIVAATLIQPDDPAGLVAEDLPIMYGVTWLDPAELAESQLVSDLRIEHPDTPETEDRTKLIVTGLNGEPIGAITWRSPQPGQELIQRVLPAVIFIGILLITGSWIAARATGQQAADYLRERTSARTDPVTGVLNRMGLSEIAATDMVQDAIRDGRVAVIYVDLNGLKALNDKYGHTVGDAAISITAKRLRRAIRAKDHVARLGGDEFACLIIDDMPTLAAKSIAARIESKTQRAFTVADQSLVATASIGIAFAQPGLTWEALLDQADEAMYQAKREERSKAVIFDSNLQAAG